MTVDFLIDLFSKLIDSPFISFILPNMRDRNFGRIICLSSVNALKGQVGQANYCASKSALSGFIKAIALENASKNITANLVAPGYIDKRLLESLLKELSNWKNTERIGIIKTDNHEKLLHPSLNILIEEKKISELSDFESSPLFDWDLKDKTCTIEWK